MLDTRGSRDFHSGGVETIRVNGRIIDTSQVHTLKRDLASEFEIIGAAHGAEAAGPEGTPPDKAASGPSVYRRWIQTRQPSVLRASARREAFSNCVGIARKTARHRPPKGRRECAVGLFTTIQKAKDIALQETRADFPAGKVIFGVSRDNRADKAKRFFELLLSEQGLCLNMRLLDMTEIIGVRRNQ
jgi:hypothetical protein